MKQPLYESELNVSEIIDPKSVKIYGLDYAVKCSKYPMSTDIETCNSDITPTVMKLGMAEAGTGHNNFLKGIIVEFDLTMSPKMSVELERYHFIDFISSCSTMHKITKFDLDDSYLKWVDGRCIAVVKELVREYNDLSPEDKASDYGKELYLRILYSNPAGFKLSAGMVTNYLQLKTIYQQRHNHRLPEWRAFCRWLETLPYSEWITGKDSTIEE